MFKKSLERAIGVACIAILAMAIVGTVGCATAGSGNAPPVHDMGANSKDHITRPAK